jgi:hypothetical protein
VVCFCCPYRDDLREFAFEELKKTTKRVSQVTGTNTNTEMTTGTCSVASASYKQRIKGKTQNEAIHVTGRGGL